ncbi:hypothetical protein B0H63DRAFT_405486 [Podospora didyma]|uniref:Uncharacterized protein n=1 Tax=Podospora didyma TaxID=330526 RepID=A0AAE0N1X7_9PEZI|nr:hypothetical protein B0H63DRAFT_405486 [Podospora didyma]
MSFDWAHQFCLACDKQTDGTTYCSESCRLADYEKTLSAPSSALSPLISHTSVCSFGSGLEYLPDKAVKELGEYAKSFESVKRQRAYNTKRFHLPPTHLLFSIRKRLCPTSLDIHSS